MTSYRPSAATTVNHSNLLAQLATVYGTNITAVSSTDSTDDNRLDPNALQNLVSNWSLLQTYGEQALQQGNDGNAWTGRTLPERLATLLVRFSDDSGILAGVSHQVLADFLGTNRENIGAMLRAFRRQGLVELGARRIQIVDEAGLREVGDVWDWV